jgi:hypothetical protein
MTGPINPYGVMAVQCRGDWVALVSLCVLNIRPS